MLFWRYCKDIQIYFGYFGDAWLYTTKIIVSTCRRLWFLSPSQKLSSWFTSSLRYYILKNPAIWLAGSIWVGNSRTRILPDMVLPDMKYQYQVSILFVILDYFQKKLMTIFFKKSENPYFGPFLHKFGQNWIFKYKRALWFFNISMIYHCAKNQRKLLTHSWEKCWTDRWIDRQTDGGTDNSDFIRPSVGRESNY